MKQLILTLMIALMSVMASTPVSAKTNKPAVKQEQSQTSLISAEREQARPNVKSELKKSVPANLIVKQTTQFTDGRTLVVYYKKQGTSCEVYSPCSTKDYDVSDASKIKSTNFEVVDQVEGKLYKKASVGEVTRFIKRMVNKYL